MGGNRVTERSATVPVSADGGTSNARLGAAYLEVKLYANTHAGQREGIETPEIRI